MISALVAHDDALADRHGKRHPGAGLERSLAVALDAQHGTADVNLIVDDVAEEGDVDDGAGEPVLASSAVGEPDRLGPDYHHRSARCAGRLRRDRCAEFLTADTHARDTVHLLD